MDDYKKKLIELVRARPLIWDPQNPDYHNKEQRKQVWEDINRKFPPGTITNSKAIWDSLSRSFSNALRRKKNKPSGSEAGNDKEWKFEKDLMFLLPVKTLRKTAGNVPGPDMDTTINYYDDDEDSISFQSQPDNVVENSLQEDVKVETEIGIRKEGVSSMQQSQTKRKAVQNIEPQTKRKAVQNIEQNDTSSTIFEMMEQRQAEKSKESPRLNFFRSLMPTVDSLDEDQFMNFQIDVIQALQRQKRVRRHPAAYQQPQSPGSLLSV